MKRCDMHFSTASDYQTLQLVTQKDGRSSRTCRGSSQNWAQTHQGKFTSPMVCSIYHDNSRFPPWHRRSRYEKMMLAVWNKAKDDEWPAGLTLGGRLHFQTHKEPAALRVSLRPLQIDQKSNRLFRKFGAHRFLRITFPTPTSKDFPSHIERRRYNESVINWLSTPCKRLLGCSWTVVFVKPGSATNKAKERFGESDGRQAFFFA